MKRNLVLLLFLIVTFSSFSEEKEKLIIGVVYDGLMKDNQSISSLMKKEFTTLLGNNYDIQFPQDKQLVVTSLDKEVFSKKLDLLLEDKAVDIVIAGGILSSYVALDKNNLSKPLFAPFIVNDIKNTKISSSGKNNLNFISSNINFKTEIENFKKIRNFKKLTILIDKSMLMLIPELNDLTGVEFVDVNGSNLKEVYNKIKTSEAVAFTPMANINSVEINNLIAYVNENKIPSFSLFSSEYSDFNVLAGYSFEKELKKRVRATALNISLYLGGKSLDSLPVYIETGEPNFAINMKVVEQTGIWPSWDILAQSKLLNFMVDEKSNMAMSLKELIEIALNNNPKISGLKKELEISDLSITKAKSNYKPDVDFSATGLIIDKDRAESILTPAEKTLNAGITVTQLIFNEDANMNIDIQKKKKELKKEEFRKAELDMILETTEAYMAVLKTESFAKIQKNNLELTRQNLELAKERKSVGISGQADVYRLESEFSRDVSDLIGIMLNIDMAKTNLKRIIKYNISQKIEIKDISLDDSDFITSNKELLNLISDRNTVDFFIKYLTEEAFSTSPELKSISYGINIQERLVKNAKNKKIMPTVAMQGDFSVNNIIAQGAGSTAPDFSSIGNISDGNTKKSFGDVLGAFGSPDEYNWSIAVAFKLPIYSGGEIETDRKIAEESIGNLEYQKESAKKYMEQQISASILQVISEYSKIQTADVSLDSAIKALNLVKDIYSNGLSTVSDLISAQTGVFSAEQYKSTITYDLLTAVMRAERISGDYYILKNDKEKLEISKKLEEIKTGGSLK